MCNTKKTGGGGKASPSMVVVVFCYLAARKNKTKTQSNEKRKPLFNVLSLRTTVVNQKTHTENIGPVMVVAGLG